MTEPDDQSSADLETRRRRARFRSWHRGMREADLIFGRFADGHIQALNADELEQYETLLEIPDGDLVKWVTGEKPVPSALDTPLFRAIRDESRSLTTQPR